MTFLFALTILLTTPETKPSMQVERHSIGLAREVAKTTVFEKPLLFQVEYTSDLEPTYIVMPLNANRESQREWRLSYVPSSSGTEDAPKTWLRKEQTPDRPRTSSEVETGVSFQVAMKTLDEAGRLSFPFIVSLRESSTEWRFTFERVPRVSGGITTVVIARRDRNVSIIPGH